MSILANPMHNSSERAFTLQKYLILHSQHDALQKRISSLSDSGSAVSSTSTSPSTSPLVGGRNHLCSFSTTQPKASQNASRTPVRPMMHKRRSSFPQRRPSETPTFIEMGKIAQEELKLMRVNQQIKRTLTELVNCEDVRTDGQYRKWCLTRLMDAEMELKGGRAREGRRRRSSAGFEI